MNHQLVTDRAISSTRTSSTRSLTLTLSDPIFLPAVMAAPLLAVGIHPVVVYNLSRLSAFWFSGMAVYLLVNG